VTGFVAAEFADEAVAQQVEIADRVEDLVLDELVFVTEPVLVHHAGIVEHDRVVEIAAEREIARTQCLDVAHEAEGARPTDFLEERRRGEIHGGALRAALEDGVAELDLEVHLETVEGIEAGPLVAVLDLHRLADADEALGRALLLDPR